MKNLSDSDGRITLWDSATHTAHTGNFQVTAIQEANNIISASLACFYFQTTEDVKKFLWFTFSSSTMTLRQSGQTIVLDANSYANIRNAIEDKLKGVLSSYVSNLDIQT
jgi:hypothetical protein